MSTENPNSTDYEKPVAYDAEGRPLYAHPAEQAQTNDSRPQFVQIVRSSEPEKQVISEELRLKHEQSKKEYSNCDLSEGEYIITTIRRHPIGMILPVVLGIFLCSLALIILFNFDMIIQPLQSMNITLSSSVILLPVIIFVALVAFGMYVSYYVYSNNLLFLTNESVIQEIQSGVFSRRERMVSLQDIEDVSYTQDGIIEHMFNFGQIRISTKGEGTIYHFKYVPSPKVVIATLNNAVESFKNGRAIS